MSKFETNKAIMLWLTLALFGVLGVSYLEGGQLNRTTLNGALISLTIFVLLVVFERWQVWRMRAYARRTLEFPFCVGTYMLEPSQIITLLDNVQAQGFAHVDEDRRHALLMRLEQCRVRIQKVKDQANRNAPHPYLEISGQGVRLRNLLSSCHGRHYAHENLLRRLALPAHKRIVIRD